MIRLAFQALQAWLKEIEKIVDVEWYNQQDLDLPETPLKMTPRLYLEFNDVPTSTMGQGLQSFDMTFLVRLVTEHYTEDIDVENHYLLSDQVYTKLQGARLWMSHIPKYAIFKDTDSDQVLLNSISRTRIIPDHSHTQLMVSAQQFSCKALDVAALLTYLEKDVSLQVEC